MVRTKQRIPRPGVGGLIAHVRHVVELKDAVVAAASEGLVRGIVDCVVGVDVAHPGKRNACVQSSDADIRGSQSQSQSQSTSLGLQLTQISVSSLTLRLYHPL